MSTFTIDLIPRYTGRQRSGFLIPKPLPPSFCFSSQKPNKQLLPNAALFCHLNPPRARLHATSTAKASSTDTAAPVEPLKSVDDVLLMETFPITRKETMEGKLFIKLDKKEKDERHWELSVGCSLPGKWILHWGVSYVEDIGSEWDQPPENMRPPGSISIKDYAIETPLKKSAEGVFHEVKIDIDPKCAIAAINFVLKDEETGAWYQHRGRDFKVPLMDNLLDDGNVVGAKRGSSMWPGYKFHYN